MVFCLFLFIYYYYFCLLLLLWLCMDPAAFLWSNQRGCGLRHS